ncbi:MAG: hypothetical protein M3Y32_10195 [Pseudomonadota bacterium]|nr:hypothetical protein [Pseudomonadota bacterium]
MISSPEELLALQHATDLEPPLAAVESQLALLAHALRLQDLVALDRAAADLHQALSAAVSHFARAAHHGFVPPGLRQRLAQAGGQVAAQREALARATASLDRAIDVLLPPPFGAPGTAALYAANGSTDQAGRSNGLLA